MIQPGLSRVAHFFFESHHAGFWRGAGFNKTIIIAGLTSLFMSMSGCANGEDAFYATSDPPPAVQPDVVATPNQPGHQVGCAKSETNSNKSWRAKISANLLCAEIKSRAANMSFVDMAAQMGMAIAKGGVTLDVTTSRLDDDVKRKFSMRGVSITFISAQYKRLSLIIRDPALLEQLARIPEVRMIMPEYGGRAR